MSRDPVTKAGKGFGVSLYQALSSRFGPNAELDSFVLGGTLAECRRHIPDFTVARDAQGMPLLQVQALSVLFDDVHWPAVRYENVIRVVHDSRDIESLFEQKLG